MIDFLQNRPVAGVITWFTGWIFGSAQITTATAINHEYILFYFQIVSLCIGSVAGILTIIALCKKFSKKEKNAE